MPVMQVGCAMRWCTVRCMQQASQGLCVRGTARGRCRAETANACCAVGTLMHVGVLVLVSSGLRVSG
eukprot:11946944-Alexandrium_andersonii.AAC.1